MFNNAQIAEALNTVLEINNDDTPRIAFFGYAGHTTGIQIDVYPLGWDEKPADYYSYRDYADIDLLEKTIHHGKKSTQIRFDNFEQLLDDVRKVGS